MEISNSQNTYYKIKTKDKIKDENNFNSTNYLNENIEKKNQNEFKKEIKKGQYFLTPLESLLLNRLMPHGFKFETEDNIIKNSETTKNQQKRNRPHYRYLDNPYKLDNIPKNSNCDIKMTQLKRRISHSPYSIENLSNNTTPDIYKVAKKCKIGLDKIKDTPWSNCFYESYNPDIPCISKIEKKISNYEYKSFYDFAMDVRKIWSYFFNLGDQENSDLYDKTSKMSDKWEQIYSELENSNEMFDISNNIKKRTDLRNQYSNKESIIPPSIKKGNKNNDNIPMTLEEKQNLGNLIKNLNKEQLRGIIRIVTEGNNIVNSKYFEFDIDKLSIKKLRELEKYVKNCLSSNNINNKANLKSINNNELVSQKENKINEIIKKDNFNDKVNNNDKQNKSLEQKIDNKEIIKDLEKKKDNSTENKIKQISNKKNNNSESDSFSESDSISSGSSLSN